MAERIEITQVLVDLEEFFRSKYNEREYALACRLFASVHPDVLQAARDNLCATSKWLPKLVEIRIAVKAVTDNSSTATVFQPAPDEHDRRLYWLAMDAYSNALTGSQDGQALERDKTYLWFERQAKLHPDTCSCKICQGADHGELWRQSCAEVDAWMVEEQVPA